LLQTPESHADFNLLEQAVTVVEEVIAEVDTKTGLSKCQFAISCLDYVDDRQVFTDFVWSCCMLDYSACTIEQMGCMLDVSLFEYSRTVVLAYLLFCSILLKTENQQRNSQKRAYSVACVV